MLQEEAQLGNMIALLIEKPGGRDTSRRESRHEFLWEAPSSNLVTLERARVVVRHGVKLTRVQGFFDSEFLLQTFGILWNFRRRLSMIHE